MMFFHLLVFLTLTLLKRFVKLAIFYYYNSILKARAGQLSSSKVLEFIESFVNEDNVTVWKDLLTNMHSLSSVLLTTDYHNKLKMYTNNLVKPISKKLGWEPIPGESNYLIYSSFDVGL